MIVIRCDKCRRIMENIRVTTTTSCDYLDYWRKTDSHLCNECWIKAHKDSLPTKDDLKELPFKEVKDCPKPIVRHRYDTDTDYENPYNNDPGTWPTKWPY